MTVRRTLPVLTVVLAMVSVSCLAVGAQPRHAAAQALIDSTVAAYPSIVRLTIHAIPTGQTQSRIIACNVGGKIGRLSDPEDLAAVAEDRTILLREGDDWDVTAPIRDTAGHPIAATGITLSLPPGTTEDEALIQAKAIAATLTDAIQSSPTPMW